MIFAVVFALAAAVSNAVNLLAQHLASVAAPARQTGWRLALYLVRSPLWLLGGAAAVASYVLQALALYNGPLSVVQPALVTELIFVMVLRRVWVGQQVTPAAWASVTTVAVALAVFITAAEPAGSQRTPEPGGWLSAGLVFGGVIVVLAVLGMRGSPVRRAGVLAGAAALAWALEATFLKTATDILGASGIGGLLTGWPVYAFAAATITGTVLQQAALHVGPLSVSQPLLVITDPFASIILSIWLFGEHFTSSPARITVAVAAFAVMAAGVTAVTRTAPPDLPPPAPAGS
jgi:hypothetical protein